MTCYENSEEEKYVNGEEENKQESKNPYDDERKVDPGTARNSEEPQGIPMMQLYVSNVFMTGITNEWEMSMIEDNLATSRLLSSVRAWIESSKHGQEEKSQNMINAQLARKKSTIEHRSSNISRPCENAAHAQPSVSHKEDEIQILNMGRASVQVKILKRMIGNQEREELKRSQKMRLRVGLKMSRKKKSYLSPGKTRKTMKLCSGSLYLLEKMVKTIMT